MNSAPLLVVLAAGKSTRLGRDKATVPLSETPGDTPLARLLVAGSAVTKGSVLVLGPTQDSADLALPELPSSPAIVINPEPKRGRTGSVQCAALAWPGRDLLIAPVDVPTVSERTFAALVEAWSSAGSPPRGWLAPRHGGVHGHPILMGRKLAEELISLDPGLALRRHRKNADPLLEVVVDDPGILDDLDHPADLEELGARLPPQPPR